MLNKNSDCLVISTDLKDSVSKSVLQNVLRQLSEGIWETSTVMPHYWPFVKIEIRDDQVCIVITTKDDSYCWKYVGSDYNYFIHPQRMNKDVKRIKNWFADKIRTIVYEERKAFPDKGIEFSSKCNKRLCYMCHHGEDDTYRGIKVCEAYAVYKHLKDSSK